MDNDNLSLDTILSDTSVLDDARVQSGTIKDLIEEMLSETSVEASGMISGDELLSYFDVDRYEANLDAMGFFEFSFNDETYTRRPE